MTLYVHYEKYDTLHVFNEVRQFCTSKGGYMKIWFNDESEEYSWLKGSPLHMNSKGATYFITE